MTQEQIAAQKQLVLAEAESWLGPPPNYRVITRYQHGELVKGVAASCGTFIAAVWNNALGAHLVAQKCVEQWYMHEKKQLYIQGLEEQGFVEIPRAEVQPCDLAVSAPRNDIYSHGAIITAWPKPATIIHCSSRGVERVRSMWASWFFGQNIATHKFYRWGEWR